jgi:hypothetical protein
MIAANNGYLLAFDNLSGLAKWSKSRDRASSTPCSTRWCMACGQ